MSVNAVNAAAPQQKQGNPIASAIATGVGLGAVAGGAGYYIGNKRPNLDEVFTMQEDEFKKAVENHPEELKDDVNKIKAARQQYADAVNEKVPALAKARKAKVDAIKAQTPDNLAELMLKNAEAEIALSQKEVGENKLKKASVDTEQEVARSEYKEKVKIVKGAGENATEEQKNALTEAENKLKEANKKSKEFYKGASEEVGNLRNAQKEIATAKRAKLAEETKTSLNEAIENAKAELTNTKASKLTELTAVEENKNAFNKIKHLFPKEGGKKIGLIAAGIAAAVGLIAGYAMGNNKQA